MASLFSIYKSFLGNILTRSPITSSISVLRGGISPSSPPAASNMLANVRPVTYASFQKGKRKSVKTVIARFYRLEWGGWIRPKAGRHTKVYRKNGSMKDKALEHVFCSATQSHLLDKMVCKYWRTPRYYVDDPYESYHKRDNYFVTRKHHY